MNDSGDFYEKYYSYLKGWTCVDVKINCEEDSYDGYKTYWPVLVFENPKFEDKIELEISRDEEGNGPGFAFGLPFPK